LSGAERGRARNELRQLVERLGRHVRSRPVVFVWAKSDLQPVETIKQSIRSAVNEHLPNASEVESTTNHPATLNEAVGCAVALTWNAQPFGSQLMIPRSGGVPFHAYRGHHD
jgi:hypothetical protein